MYGILEFNNGVILKFFRNTMSQTRYLRRRSTVAHAWKGQNHVDVFDNRRWHFPLDRSPWHSMEKSIFTVMVYTSAPAYSLRTRRRSVSCFREPVDRGATSESYTFVEVVMTCVLTFVECTTGVRFLFWFVISTRGQTLLAPLTSVLTLFDPVAKE